MTTIGTQTPSYDADGNVTNDFLHSYTWDAYGRPITVADNLGNSVGVTYDALGRVVEQNRSGTYTQVQYSPSGFKMQLITNGVYTAFVPLPGGAEAVWPAGPPYYRHPDWLGSSRLTSTTSRTVQGGEAYAPFGETYAASGTPDNSFTGMDQGTVGNEYDFPAREYGIQGRWPSPDPAGLLAVDPTDPQSWNRYAYVRNNPLSSTDPSGLDLDPCEFDCGGGGGGFPPCFFGCGERDRNGPQAPLYNPPDVGTDPNPPSGESASGDPWAFGCESLGIPCGMQFPGGGGGFGSSGCDFVECGLIGNSLTTDANGNTIGSRLGETICIGHPGEACIDEFWNGSEWEVGLPLSPQAAGILGSAGRSADVGVKAAMVATAPEYALMGGVGAIEGAEAGLEAGNVWLSNPQNMAEAQEFVKLLPWLWGAYELRRIYGPDIFSPIHFPVPVR
jgi:RHS repeat-associated protein